MGTRAEELHDLESGPVVTELAAVAPKARRAQRRGRGSPADHARLQSRPPAQGRARQLRTIQPELLQQPEHLVHRRPDHRPSGKAQRRRLTMPGQVDENDLLVRCQPVDDRGPCLPTMTNTVQQHQRRTRTEALVSQPHRTLPDRG